MKDDDKKTKIKEVKDLAEALRALDDEKNAEKQKAFTGILTPPLALFRNFTIFAFHKGIGP